MLSETLARPIVLSPDERYLCGHYLAYLLGGPRRRGLFLRRPLDERNADLARLLLAMSWLSCVSRPRRRSNMRPCCSTNAPRPRRAHSRLGDQVPGQPDTPAKLRRFRQVRMRLQEASTYAGRDARPQGSAESRHAAQEPRRSRPARPAPRRAGRTSRSLRNRVTDVWRRHTEFRQAVLRYASRSDDLDGVGVDLWPEVVYPLIQVPLASDLPAPPRGLWDYIVGRLLHSPCRASGSTGRWRSPSRGKSPSSSTRTSTRSRTTCVSTTTSRSSTRVGRIRAAAGLLRRHDPPR